MSKDNARKIRLLKIWDILCSETDESHPMQSTTLLKRLESDGIDCDRRTLYGDIEVLNDYGYEVMSARGSKNEYWVSERKFDVPEVQILMDAVQAAGFITEEKTGELVDKIAGLAGKHKGDVLKQNIVAFGTVKSKNEKIYYLVNEIATAINEKKKIRYRYFDYDENHKRIYRKNRADGTEKQYTVSPLATVFANDNYYLFCRDDKHSKVSRYRVDRMDGVRVLDERIAQDGKAEELDLSKLKSQVFCMYGGDKERVCLEADKALLDVIFDKFGDNIYDRTATETAVRFAVDVEISPTFLAWCCAFGDQLKVLAPQSTVRTVRDYLAKTLKQYE